MIDDAADGGAAVGAEASLRAQMVDFHHGIGKWIIATLLILNGAPLFALLSKDTLADGLFGAVAWPLIVGVGCALTCAAYSWFNAGLIAGLYPEFMDWAGLGRGSTLRKRLLLAVPIVQFVFGTAALVAFGIGVYQGMKTLERPASRPAATGNVADRAKAK